MPLCAKYWMPYIRWPLRKRKANEAGPKAGNMPNRSGYVSVRLPAYLPMRVNDELVEILREFKEKLRSRRKPVYYSNSFSVAAGGNPEAREAIKAILSAGGPSRTNWYIPLQLPVAVILPSFANCSTTMGVVCYYTFSVKDFRKLCHVYTQLPLVAGE